MTQSIKLDSQYKGCPTPRKNSYNSRKEAKRVARKGQTSYQCCCGAWHLTYGRNAARQHRKSNRKNRKRDKSMATHAYHPHCPNYDKRQILHDGCAECEARGKDFRIWAAHADTSTWDRAWRRAYDLHSGGGNRDGLGELSVCEVPILKTIWAFQVALEARGLQLSGAMPEFTPMMSVTDMLKEGAPES